MELSLGKEEDGVTVRRLGGGDEMVNCYIKRRRIGSRCVVTAGMGQDQCTAEKELVENGGQSATEARSGI